MASQDLHRRRIGLRRIIPVDRQGVPRAERRPQLGGLRGIEIGIRRAGVHCVRLASLPYACGRHVVDMLERAPDPLRPALCLDRDMKSDERDVALRADHSPGGDRFGRVDDLAALDVISPAHRSRIRGRQGPPGSLYRDRSNRKVCGVIFVRQIPALTPAAGGEGPELSLVEMGFVARVCAVPSDQRVGGRADHEARLVEIGERVKRSDRLLPVVDPGAARIAAVVARPWRRRDAAAVVPELEQFVVGFERLPDPRPGIIKRSPPIRRAAPSSV